jgi:vancomycin permeability regulator SanA
MTYQEMLDKTVRTTSPGPGSRDSGKLVQMQRLPRIALRLVLVVVLAVLLLRGFTVLRYRGSVYHGAATPAAPVALVFGAGVGVDGEPTLPLHDRVATAAELYHAGTVERLLLSGDGRDQYADEPEAMRRLALSLGVPDQADVRRAVLVTQEFHLPRALMLCRDAGIDVVGVAGDEQKYPWRWAVSWEARETVATAYAWWEVTAHR